MSAPATSPALAAAPARRSIGLGAHAVDQAVTLLRGWARDPAVIIQAVVFPAFLLLMFQLVLGKTVTAMGSGDSVYGNTGLVALVGAMYGTIVSGISLIRERESGLLARMWTMPVPRAGFPLGRLLAEALRTMISTAVVFVVALPLGFRFHEGVLAGIGAFLVPVVFVVGVACPLLALAAVSSGPQAVQSMDGLFLFMLFFNTGFAPVGEYPGWLQPVVRHQPMSPAIDTMRGLTAGGPVAEPLAWCVGWTLLSVAVFAVPAVRALRRASQKTA